MIHACSYLPLAFTMDPSRVAGHPLSHSNLPGQLSTIINLHELQEAILQMFVTGKPLIDQASVTSLRTPFKFREDISNTSLHIK